MIEEAFKQFFAVVPEAPDRKDCVTIWYKGLHAPGRTQSLCQPARCFPVSQGSGGHRAIDSIKWMFQKSEAGQAQHVEGNTPKPLQQHFTPPHWLHVWFCFRDAFRAKGRTDFRACAAGAASAMGKHFLSDHSAWGFCHFKSNTGLWDAGFLSSPYIYGYPKPFLGFMGRKH